MSTREHIYDGGGVQQGEAEEQIREVIADGGTPWD